MARHRIKDIDKGWNSIRASLKEFEHGYVKVGIPDSKQTDRRTKAELQTEAQGIDTQSTESQVTNSKKPKISNLMLGMIHEYGSKHNPKRSWLRASFDRNIQKLTNTQRVLYNRVLSAKLRPKRGLGLLGAAFERIIKDYIRNMSHPPLKPETVKRKGSNKLLIDSAQLINSITHVVVSDDKIGGSK